MLRHVLAAALLVVVLNRGASAQPPTSVIDQENLPQSPPITQTFALGGPSEQVLSQIVTAGATGRLTEVQIPLGCESGDVVLQIRDVDPATGQPGSRILARRTFVSAETRFPVPVSDEFQSLPISGALDFSIGETFAIVLTNIALGGSCGVWPAPPGDSYFGGSAFADANDGPIVPLLASGTDDLPFRTIMRVH